MQNNILPNPLPSIEDAQLTQVCFGQYEVITLNFTNNVSLTIEGSYFIDDIKESNDGLISLIGKNISTLAASSQDVLELKFGESILQVLNSNTEYESYTLSLPGQTIVV